MSHEHDWINITAIGDLEERFICSGCDARRTGSQMAVYPDSPVGGEPKRDGWDGMRRFFKQLDETRWRP